MIRARELSVLVAPTAAAVALLISGCAVTINQPSANSLPPSQPVAPPTRSAIPINRIPPVPANTPTQNNSATVFETKGSNPPGLKIVNAELTYNDGDVLTANFRVYCPTSMIRPTDFTLKNANGTLKKQGAWWEPAFQPKWEAERSLVEQACRQM